MNTTELAYEYHHMGIPTTVPQPGETYSSTFKMYTTDGNNPLRMQWHRFEADSPLHPLLKTRPHVAFKVKSIDEAIRGKHVLLEPYFPFEKFRVAAIEENGAIIELIETSLSEGEIWGDHQHPGKVLE